jgi:hypothetical protein
MLGELHDLALLFPSVRPKGTAIEAFADRLAAGMADEPREPTPAEAAEELVADDPVAAAGVAELLVDAYVMTVQARASYISRRN